MGNEINVKFWR